MSDLHELTASEAAERIRSRDLSPLELVDALLDRIEAVDAKVQAWELVDAEGARSLAAERERQAARGELLGPLHGVPIGVKDVYLTAGMRTAASFRPLSNFVPDHDATAVALLRRSGAIVLGKTVTTQFAYVDPSRTRNPWNLERSPGGSSSGSGAAVAARTVPAALGTQTVGSVLRPAAFNGVVGFKPTFGRCSRYGIFPDAWSLDHPGWLCRSVQDAARLLSVLAGRDAHDPATIDRPVGSIAPASDGRPPRLGLIRDFLDRSSDEVCAHAESVADQLRRAGAIVDEIAFPAGVMDLLQATITVVISAEMASVHAEQAELHAADYGPGILATVRVGQVMPANAYVHAQRLRRRLLMQVLATLGDRDAFLSPTVSTEAPDPRTTGDRTLQAPWSLLGFPAISLPSSLSANRLPLAIQLGAPSWRDAELLAVAGWCEARLEPLPVPPVG